LGEAARIFGKGSGLTETLEEGGESRTDHFEDRGGGPFKGRGDSTRKQKHLKSWQLVFCFNDKEGGGRRVKRPTHGGRGKTIWGNKI